MMSCLGAIGVLWLAGYAGQTMGDRSGQIACLRNQSIVECVTSIALRLKGRFLGQIIIPGMTTEQVERVIGKDPLHPLPRGFLAAGAAYQFVSNGELGIAVQFRLDKERIFRVIKVSYKGVFE